MEHKPFEWRKDLETPSGTNREGWNVVLTPKGQPQVTNANKMKSHIAKLCAMLKVNPAHGLHNNAPSC